MEKRFGVVSADGHCRLMHLPFDLWTKRLPKKFADDGPRGVTGNRRYPTVGGRGTPVERGRLGRRPVNCYTRAGIAEELASPASSAQQMLGIAARIWTGTGWMPNW